MEQAKPQIIDITVKEGGYLIDHHFLPEQMGDIARELQRAHVSHAEICHGCGIGSFRRGFSGLVPDKDLLRAAREAAPDLKFCVYISGSPGGVMEIDALAEHFELGRVGINVDQADGIKEHLTTLKRLKKTAIAQLLRVHLHTPEQVAKIAKGLSEHGADIIYLTDTFGSMSGEEVETYVKAVRSHVTAAIGFQGSNNTGRALDNAIRAFHAGATWLDGAWLGMGRGGGTVNLAVLVFLLQQEGLRTDIDLNELLLAEKNYVFPAVRRFPQVRYVDFLFAKHKIDYYPAGLLPQLAQILGLGEEEFILRLKKFRPGPVPLTQATLRDYLATENLSFDVVMEYLLTGKVPGVHEA